MSDKEIERAALGRIGGLGDLYDARSDSFCISMLKMTVPPSAVTTTDNEHTDMKLLIGDNLSEKFSKLDVSAELSISVMAGLLSLSGSAKYLDTKKESKRAGQASLLYNSTTKVDKLLLFSDELRKCISLEALSHVSATHVVTEIYWGASSLITVKDENRNNEDTTKIEGHLKATLEKVCLKIGGVEGGVEFEESEKAGMRNYSIEIFADVLADKSQLLPSTLEDAIKMMQQMPALIQKANAGKGIPLKYKLFPLSAKCFHDHLRMNDAPIAKLRSVENHVIDEFMNVINGIAQLTQEVSDIISDVNEMEYMHKCVPAGTIKPFKEVRHKISNGETKLRGKLATLLKNVRSGNEDTSALDLESLISDYRTFEVDAEKLRDGCYGNYKALKPKHDLVKRCQRYSVTYLTSVEDGLVDMGEVVVFYGNTEKAKTDEKRWAQNRRHFFNLADENQNKQQRSVAGGSSAKQFYYVDCDFDPVTAEEKGIRIEQYTDGECVDEDVAYPVHVPRVVHTLPETDTVFGVTSLDDELYVLRRKDTEQVEVYSTTTDDYRLVRRLSVPGEKGWLWVMTSCKHYRCLYICDSWKWCVYRVELNGKVTKLSVKYKPRSLSVTSQLTVLVTCCELIKLLELTTEGKQIREITLQPDIVNLQHAIQLSNGQFVVSHGYRGPVQRVCIVDTNGHVTQSYGGSQGSATVGQLNEPCHLAVDKDEFIFVADKNNNRVLLLSPTLDFVREIVSRDQLKFGPWQLLLDVDRRRLYVAVDCGVVVFQL